MNKTVLYVTGFSSSLRAKDLAWEFERYGRLIRCDIPAPKTPSSTPFAFIEFRYERDAEDAYYDMHGRSIDRRRISVQWAKRPPSSQWRHDGFTGPDRRERIAETGGEERHNNARGRTPSPAERDAGAVTGGNSRQSERRRSLSPMLENGRSRPGPHSGSPIEARAGEGLEVHDNTTPNRRDGDNGDV